MGGQEWREGVKEEGVEEGSNRNEELVGEGRGEGEEEEGRGVSLKGGTTVCSNKWYGAGVLLLPT